MRVAIIGTGNIGTDLLLKVQRSPLLECALFAGRNLDSAGHAAPRATSACPSATARSTRSSSDAASSTSSSTRPPRSTRDAPLGAAASRSGIPVIDLTPAKLGELCIPALNLADCAHEPNLCMVTCGGQAAVPLAALRRGDARARRVRRDRLDERLALGRAGDAHQHRRVPRDDRGGGQRASPACGRAKTILIVNPSDPPITMQNTVFAKTDEVGPAGADGGRRGDGRGACSATCPATGSSCRRCTRAAGSR